MPTTSLRVRRAEGRGRGDQAAAGQFRVTNSGWNCRPQDADHPARTQRVGSSAEITVASKTRTTKRRTAATAQPPVANGDRLARARSAVGPSPPPTCHAANSRAGTRWSTRTTTASSAGRGRVPGHEVLPARSDVIRLHGCAGSWKPQAENHGRETPPSVTKRRPASRPRSRPRTERTASRPRSSARAGNHWRTVGGIPLKRQKTAVLTDRLNTGPLYPNKELTKAHQRKMRALRAKGRIQVHHVRQLADPTGPASRSLNEQRQ